MRAFVIVDDLVSQGLHQSSILLAAAAGILYGVAQLGKRCGAVVQSTDREAKLISWQSQLVSDSILASTYVFGQSLPAVAGIWLHRKSAKDSLDPEFWKRMPLFFTAETADGVGILLSTILIARAGRLSMTAMAVTFLSSFYAIIGPALVAWFFNESINGHSGFAFALSVVGVYLISDQTSISDRHEYAILLALSLLATLGWSIGNAGGIYVMKDVKPDSRFDWSLASFALQHIPDFAMTAIPAVVMPLITTVDTARTLQTTSNRFKACICGGIVSGIGGLMMQYALAEQADIKAVLVGTYLAALNLSALCITRAVYQEPLALQQLLGFACLLAAVLLVIWMRVHAD